MANFDIHIGSQPITYSSKVTFNTVEDCDVLNNDIEFVLLSPVLEEHSLLKSYGSSTNVKELVITYVHQDDINQYLAYEGVQITNSSLPLTVPLTGTGAIIGLNLVEKFVPTNNVTSLRIDFYIIDENDTVGPTVSSYVQDTRIDCTAVPVVRNPYLENIDITPDLQECQTANFTVKRNGSANPVKYKITTLFWGVEGYIGNLQDIDTAVSYIAQAYYTGSTYTGTLKIDDVNGEANLLYRICAAPSQYTDNECGVLFQIYKEDGVTVNTDENITFMVSKAGDFEVDPGGPGEGGDGPGEEL